MGLVITHTIRCDRCGHEEQLAISEPEECVGVGQAVRLANERKHEGDWWKLVDGPRGTRRVVCPTCATGYYDMADRHDRELAEFFRAAA